MRQQNSKLRILLLLGVLLSASSVYAADSNPAPVTANTSIQKSTSSEIKKASEYLTPEDISSVLGPGVRLSQPSDPAQVNDTICVYVEGEGDTQHSVASISIVSANASNAALIASYQQSLKLLKPIQDIGCTASEAENQFNTRVFLLKNGTYGFIIVPASQNQAKAKAEELARRIVSKL